MPFSVQKEIQQDREHSNTSELSGECMYLYLLLEMQDVECRHVPISRVIFFPSYPFIFGHFIGDQTNVPNYSIEQNPRLVGFRTGGMKNYPVLKGLQEAIIRIPIQQPVLHGKCSIVCFIAQLTQLTPLLL